MFRFKVAILIWVILSVASPLSAQIPQRERDALLALFNKTNGPQWTNKTNWDQPAGSECTYFGVQCSQDGTTVEALWFYDNNLSGSIPPEIAELRSLKVLDLQRNVLTGSIPSEIGQLSNLTLLGLSFNQLTGVVPEAMSNLSELRTLYICCNKLTGPIPASWGRLQNLEFVSASINQFSGQIPPELGSLPKLWRLYINSNQLTGPIPPELGNLPNLEELSVGHGNQLTGPIPIELTNLKKLRILYLGSGNKLSGTIPPELGTLTNLTELDVSSCNFTGPIPPELGNLTKLTSLRLGYNQLTGTIPAQLGALTSLVTLFLPSNKLEGSLPSELGNLQSLRTLDVNSNELTGEIPAAIGNLSSLQYLGLSGNWFSGSIPSWIGDLSSLQNLYLSGNQFAGPLPSWIGGLTALRTLDLGMNAFAGEVPPTFGGLTNLTNEQGLNLRHNALFTSSDSLRAFLDQKQSGTVPFESYQTLPPGGLTATATSPTSFRADWIPIAYQVLSGGYRVEIATSTAGPFKLVTTTPDKAARSAIVTGLSPATTYYVRVSTVTYAYSSQKNTVISEATNTVSVTTLPSETVVVLLDAPDVLSVPADGASTTSVTYTLGNIGQIPTQIQLTQTGSFFTQSPTAFELGAGATQKVTITSLPQNAAASLRGTSTPNGSGVPTSLVIPVTLLAATPPVAGSPDVIVETNRIDVAGPAGSNPTGEVAFRNVGTADAIGLLAADALWIVPDPSLIALAPGERRTVTFTIDRSLRPDSASPAGTTSATLSFVYLAGTASGRRTFNTGAPTLVTPVGVGDTVRPVVTSSGVPLLVEGELGLVIPGVGNVTGTVGVFISDLSIGNALSGRVASDLKLYYLSGTSALSASQPVSAGASVNLGDVVSTVFSKSEEIGVLHVRSSMTSQLNVNANVFNKSNPAGMCGTSIPVFRTSRAAGKGGTVVLTGLRKNETSHTNIYVQETSGTSATVDVTFLGVAGETLTVLADQPVRPFGLTVIGQGLVPEGSVTAILSNDGNGSVVAYATPVDRASGDTWAVADWNRFFGRSGVVTQVVPVAGSGPGRNNTYFRTDISIANPGASTATGTLRYYQQSPSPIAIDAAVTLLPSRTLVLDDVVAGFFSQPAPSLGHVVLIPTSGSLTMTSRTYTTVQGTSKTLGTGVPVLTLTDSLRIGQAKVIGSIKDSTAATTNEARPGTFRTNIGLVETEGKDVSVRVSLLFFDGRSLASGGAVAAKIYSLGPHEFRQLNAIASEIIGPSRETDYGDLDNVQVKVEVVGGSGGLLVYATSTDNGSGDTLLRVD